ncbi:MAG TPA: thioredoxin family protein [Blastocatellia bacterium]|nr:thioredoxin family protein [Blastocatellia bacterium]
MANDRRSDGGMMMGMFIKVMSSMALFILVFIGSEAVAQERLAIVWTDSTKDVHVNGALDRAAQVLTSDETRRMVLISPKLERAAVLDLSGRTVTTTAKEVFRLSSDRASAQSVADFSVESAGNYTVFDDSDYYFTISGTRVLITGHQGLTGETDNQRLFETVPVWRYLMDGYQPDITAVAVIKSIQAETTIIVALATWCSDSKQHIPRLLKALDAAGNPHLHIKLIGIARQLREPAETIKQRKIVHVPTVIVERDGVELGRIVENPTAKTIEQDLAAILNGTRNTAKNE